MTDALRHDALDGRPSPPAIRLREVSVGYGERPIVQGLNLDVRAGDVIAILGPNGCGKSTLIKGIVGLAPVLSGTIELFGIPAARFKDRYRIGYVPQRHTVGGAIPSTVKEVVASGRLPRRPLLHRATAADRHAVAAALDVVGLGDRAGAPVGELSGGQQRRVLIARALASEPDVLVMDEPTAGVDAASQAALATTLQRLADGNVPLVIVTHELTALASLVTTAALIREGRIAYHGALEGLNRAAYEHVHHLDEDRPAPASWPPDVRLGG